MKFKGNFQGYDNNKNRKRTKNNLYYIRKYPMTTIDNANGASEEKVKMSIDGKEESKIDTMKLFLLISYKWLFLCFSHSTFSLPL